MKKNMSSADRVIRVVIAVLLVKLYFLEVTPGILGITLLVVAIVFTLTSFTHFCPLYRFLGIRKWEAKAQGTHPLRLPDLHLFHFPQTKQGKPWPVAPSL